MIIQALVNSFKLEMLQGVHQPGDIYRMALYTADADLGEDTTTYTTRGEVFGPGYQAGGVALKDFRALLDGRTALLDWADPVWPNATLAARGALIYNFSKGNRAVVVIDFGQVFVSTNGSFTMTLPEPTAQTALIQVR
ncbi:MAG TPA: hypothetical protein VMZ92_13355 [Planctomycetota bacterium]|nr:hypothetical protein [Planctomycetota bacterium]